MAAALARAVLPGARPPDVWASVLPSRRDHVCQCSSWGLPGQDGVAGRVLTPTSPSLATVHVGTCAKPIAVCEAFTRLFSADRALNYGGDRERLPAPLLAKTWGSEMGSGCPGSHRVAVDPGDGCDLVLFNFLDQMPLGNIQ